ncbi:MAG: lytic transglycosylase domain-containing protein [Sphingomonadaceae bacterium]|nr:lytic transglycosylase domain-containing protein [Sphingomonadaceae bacterium]
MSSMLRLTAIVLLAATACTSVPALCNDGAEWDQARIANAGGKDAAMQQAIVRWKSLTLSSRLSFSDYSGFILAHPGFPSERKLRSYAEAALSRETVNARTVVSFFEKFPPLGNLARTRHALALASLNYPGARKAAIMAWRGGPMSEASEAALLFRYGDQLSREDHDARMDALLWEGRTQGAQRQLDRVSPEKRTLFKERLNLAQGNAPGSLGLPLSALDMRDPGYIHNRVQRARGKRNISAAVTLLSTRPKTSGPARYPTKWVSNLLWAARGAGSAPAAKIAASIDDAFAPGTDISALGFRLRDDYTSLMWLGGTKALWNLRDPKRAAPLFYRYGAAARTPGTRTKGFYWAGKALADAGDPEGANRYFEMAAQYPDHFYGMLSLERLDRAIPNLNGIPTGRPSPDERAAFMARPITRAVREVSRGYKWRTSVRFFREISDQAETAADHMLVADLAREIGRRDLAVILGQNAHTDGHGNFHQTAFPLIPAPPGSNWTMVHAITRQESQFAMNAISHAGARGLMQLMPGTAREQAGKMKLSYRPSSLTTDARYNIRLGDGYFGRMMDYYGGAYPLAVGAYNAGPGNVNKWLRANGDPRTGSIDWITWIERIPIYETKNYVQKVLENAVVYETLNPDRVYSRGKFPLSRFLGKRDPG